jgi:hypothetical protein
VRHSPARRCILTRRADASRRELAVHQQCTRPRLLQCATELYFLSPKAALGFLVRTRRRALRRQLRAGSLDGASPVGTPRVTERSYSSLVRTASTARSSLVTSKSSGRSRPSTKPRPRFTSALLREMRPNGLYTTTGVNLRTSTEPSFAEGRDGIDTGFVKFALETERRKGAKILHVHQQATQCNESAYRTTTHDVFCGERWGVQLHMACQN